MFRILAAALGAAFLLPAIAHAQDTSGYKVAPCVTQTGGNGIPYCAPVTSANPLPVTTTSGASGWSVGAGASGNPYSLTTSPTTITLPSPYTTVQVQNTGTSDAATCELGGTIDTKAVNIPAQSSVPFSVGSATQITCQSATATTMVAVLGGSGFAAVGGGGGGGGGSSSVTVIGPLGETNSDAQSVATTAGGTSPTGFALPSACTGADGLLGWQQCQITLMSSNIPLRAATTSPAAASDGASVQAMGTSTGKTVTQPYAPPQLANVNKGSSTTTAAITVMSASGNASLKEYLVSFACSRSDTGTTPIVMTVSDGTTSYPYVLPNAGFGGAIFRTLPVPLVFAANTAVTITPSAGASTIYCDGEGYNAP